MDEIDRLSPGYYFEGGGGVPVSWEGVGRVEMMLSATREQLERLLDGKLTIAGEIGSRVEIQGPAYIAKGAKIHDGVSIVGPVYIGERASIRHGALIRDGAVIGNECVVGHGAEIKASLCMSGSKMQSGVFVGDSILGVGARLGSGVILANRRFDQGNITLGGGTTAQQSARQFFGAVIGDYARLGANVVSAPGTLVGPYTWVASLVSLSGFIERSQLVMLKQELITRPKTDRVLRSGQGEYENL